MEHFLPETFEIFQIHPLNQDTLATIGALGREATSHSIPILAQLIEGRLSRLHGQMQRLISQVSELGTRRTTG